MHYPNRPQATGSFLQDELSSCPAKLQRFVLRALKYDVKVTNVKVSDVQIAGAKPRVFPQPAVANSQIPQLNTHYAKPSPCIKSKIAANPGGNYPITPTKKNWEKQNLHSMAWQTREMPRVTLQLLQFVRRFSYYRRSYKDERPSFPVIEKLTSAFSQTIVTHYKSIFAEHGIPAQLLTNNETESSARAPDQFPALSISKRVLWTHGTYGRVHTEHVRRRRRRSLRSTVIIQSHTHWPPPEVTDTNQ